MYMYCNIAAFGDRPNNTTGLMKHFRKIKYQTPHFATAAWGHRLSYRNLGTNENLDSASRLITRTRHSFGEQRREPPEITEGLRADPNNRIGAGSRPLVYMYVPYSKKTTSQHHPSPAFGIWHLGTGSLYSQLCNTPNTR